MNIHNTECSLVCLSFLLLGPPFKKGARKQIKTRIVRRLLDKEGSDRLGFFISEERWLWEAMMETNKVMDSVFINCCSLVISVKHKSYSLKLANEGTQWKNRLKIKQRNYFLFHPHLHQAPYAGTSTVLLFSSLPSRFFFLHILYCFPHIESSRQLSPSILDYGPLLLPVCYLTNWTVSQAIASLHILLHATFPPKYLPAMLYSKMLWKFLTGQP